MTRAEMDKLNVGDTISYRVWSQVREAYTIVKATVTNVYVCTDGGTFSHGGKHSIQIKYKLDGREWEEIADNELTI